MGLSAVALVASVWSMSTRLAEREVQNVLFGEPILDASFTYLYEPGSDGEDVEITYLKADEAGAETPVLRIGYRGLTTDYPVFKPPTEITEQLPGLLGPESFAILCGAGVEVGVRDGVVGELRRRCEPPVLDQQVIDLTAGHAHRCALLRGRTGAVAGHNTRESTDGPRRITTSVSGWMRGT